MVIFSRREHNLIGICDGAKAPDIYGQAADSESPSCDEQLCNKTKWGRQSLLPNRPPHICHCLAEDEVLPLEIGLCHSLLIEK